MKRVLLVTALVCGGSMAFPTPASASLMDWLQELSGPGPFNAKNVNLILDVCPVQLATSDRGEGIFASDYAPLRENKPSICFFVDNRLFKNDGAGDNFGAGEISLHAVEFGASVRVHRSVSIGFGAGWIEFNAKERGAETTKFLVTAPRIVFKPALLFGSVDFWDQQPKPLRIVASMFKFYIRNNIVSGRLTGADLGLRQGDANVNFAVRHDRVWSTGFVLDFSEVLALL